MRHTTKTIAAGLVLALCLPLLVNAQSTILFEDFEDAIVGYTVSTPDDLSNIANRDYFGRIDAGSGLPVDVSYLNPQGVGFYGAQDTDSTPSAVSNIMMNLTGIDISNHTNLNFSFFVAEDTAADGNEDWDITTSFRVAAQIDGGGFSNIFAVESIDGAVGNRAPAVDTNFDGIGDGAAITDVFTQFAFGLADGNLLDLQFTIEFLDTGDEDIAFDNLLLTGTFVGVPEPTSLGLLALVGMPLMLRRKR